MPTLKRNTMLIALLLGVSLLMLTIGVANATTDISEKNKVSYWCEDGIKYEPVETPFIVPAPPEGTQWTLIVLKAGTTNETHPYPKQGDTYSHTLHDNSHVILCWEETSDTTTTSPSSTTSSTVTTTTIPDTTTTVPVTTTSSSTTTIQSTSTLATSTTSTSQPMDTTTTSTGLVTTTTVMTELPMTGSTLTGIAVLGMMMLALGSAFVYSVRKTNE